MARTRYDRGVDSAYLTDNFLIAMPTLEDPNFQRSVTYVCQHNESGALGIVVNQASEITIAEILGQLQIDCANQAWGAQMVMIGGPVHRDRGFVLHDTTPEWDSSLRVTDDLMLTTSRDILEALATGQGPERAILALGYAGWDAGQLESEMLENSWLSCPADADLLFEKPSEELWMAAAHRLGIDLNRLSGIAGHA